jgi:predicted MFS family arabinose efflux permease
MGTLFVAIILVLIVFIIYKTIDPRNKSGKKQKIRRVKKNWPLWILYPVMGAIIASVIFAGYHFIDYTAENTGNWPYWKDIWIFVKFVATGAGAAWLGKFVDYEKTGDFRNALKTGAFVGAVGWGIFIVFF